MAWRAARVAILLVLGWRLIASVAAETRRLTALPLETRLEWLRATPEDRYRATLGKDYPLFRALRGLITDTPRVVLYAHADGDRDELDDRLKLIQNRLHELLFPARVVMLIGPIPDAAMPANGGSVVVANLTPDRPVPAQDQLERVKRHPDFSLWRTP